MLSEDNYKSLLQEALDTATQLISNADVEAALAQYIRDNEGLQHKLKTLKGGEEIELEADVAFGIRTLIGNLKSNKYLFSILITALVEKLVHPNQDIRIPQAGVAGGYTNRNTDAKHVTPFLKKKKLTHSDTSGSESGRNYDRPDLFTLDHPAKPKGKGNREAFLGIIHAVQVEGVDAKPCMVLLMALDMLAKGNIEYEYQEPKGLTIDEIHGAVIRHYRESKGNGRARLPVLAIQAIYKCLVRELSRYNGMVLRDPPNRHTGNDKNGWIGDIQIDREDGTPFEAVEVKADKQITPSMVDNLLRKLAGRTVERYYVLSSSNPYISPESNNLVRETAEEVRLRTGSQVVLNGLVRSLWYYLRMISDTDQFLQAYTEQIQTDQDVKDDHRALWAAILAEVEAQKSR